MADKINYFGEAPLAVSQPKRVLFIITQTEMGGAQRFLLDLAANLNPEQFHITVAAGRDGDGELLRNLKAKTSVDIRPVFSLRRNIDLIADIKAFWEIRSLIKEINPQTLFLISSKAGILGSLAARFPRTLDCKVIYRIGGWSFNDPWPYPVKLIWQTIEKLSARWKDIIVLNNTHDYNQAQKIGIKPRQTLKVIHNGINVYELDFLGPAEARAELLKHLPPKTTEQLAHKKIVGTIANFYHTKDLETFIRAARYTRSSEVVFVLIGEGRERNKLESLIKHEELENRVFLIGRIPEARRLLPAFDIFVLTSKKEGFPWALLEAMAAKLPVIATRVGAVPEMITDGNNGFIVKPEDDQAVADRIATILDSTFYPKEFGIRAHQKVMFSFALDSMVKEVEELL